MYSTKSSTYLTRSVFDNIYVTNKNTTMTFKNQTFFQIYYCHNHKMYDFTIFNSETKEIIYHYHFTNLKEINNLIQTYK